MVTPLLFRDYALSLFSVFQYQAWKVKIMNLKSLQILSHPATAQTFLTVGNPFAWLHG